MVGLPGIEPGLHDPQPRVLPLYDGPVGSHLIFVESLNAVGANFYSLAVNSRPLEVGISL